MVSIKTDCPAEARSTTLHPFASQAQINSVAVSDAQARAAQRELRARVCDRAVEQSVHGKR